MYRYDHFHTHTQTKYKLIASSVRSHYRLRLPLQLSPFCADNSTTFAQHADSKMEFQSRFLTKRSLLSDVSPPSIHPTPSTLYATLGSPPPLLQPMCHPTSILSPTLRQKWYPREKWHRALTCITAASRLSYFAVAVRWDDVDQNPPVT